MTTRRSGEMNGYGGKYAIGGKPRAAFYYPQLSLPAADSSGIANISSPSGSSDSGSSNHPPTPTPHPPSKSSSVSPFKSPGKTPGKNMHLMSKVVQKGGGGSSPVTKSHPPSPEKHRPADLFINQFQAQMSQVKSAMDAVQHEITHGLPLQPPSGQILCPVRRGRGRPPGSGKKNKTGATPPAPVPLNTVPIYHSQISTSNGLIMKIKKAPGGKRRGRKPGSGGVKAQRRKRKKNDEDDYGDSEDEELGIRLPAKRGREKSGKKKEESPEGEEDDEDETQDSGEWGESMPPKILTKIFRHLVQSDGCIPSLVRATKVCRLWWEVGSKPELWTSVDLSTGKVKDVYRSERNLIFFLENRLMHVKHLNLGGWSSAVTSGAIEVLARTCTAIESLNLSTCQKLSAQDLRTLADSCENLNKVDLSSISAVYNNKGAVSPSGIAELAEGMGPRLQHLSLANNCLANCLQILSSLADNCSNLEVLDLSSISSPRRDSIFIRIEELQQGCPSIRILRLANSDMVLADTSVKDQVSSPGFPKLEELSIAVDPKRCVGLSDSDLERIVKNANKLRLLDVRGCTRISDSGLVRVPAWDLEHLYLSGCFATKSSTDGLELILKKWRHSFKEIDVAGTPNEQTIRLAINALAEDEDIVPPLRVLDLCGSSVSFESVCLLLRRAVHLQSLNLTSCRALPRGIKRNYQAPNDVKALREQVLRGKFQEETQ